MTPARMEEIKRMLVKLSKWPWRLLASTSSRFKFIDSGHNTGLVAQVGSGGRIRGTETADAAFISQAPQIVSELVQEVERLRGVLKGYLNPETNEVAGYDEIARKARMALNEKEN